MEKIMVKKTPVKKNRPVKKAPVKKAPEKNAPEKKVQEDNAIDPAKVETELDMMSEAEIENDRANRGARPTTSAPAPAETPALAKKPMPEDQKDLLEEKNKEREAEMEEKKKDLEEKEKSLKQREAALAQRAKDLEQKEQDFEAPNPGRAPVSETIEPKEEVNPDLSFFDRDSTGTLIFSNRTHFELVFSDLGFPSPGDKFDPLIFKPYQERDLEKEGFTSDQIIGSKNMRNFIASGKMKHGKLEERDKLPENTKFASIRNLGNDVTSIGIKFTGHYLKLYQDFVAKEKRRYSRPEV
jgi:hypothetical protein